MAICQGEPIKAALEHNKLTVKLHYGETHIKQYELGSNFISSPISMIYIQTDLVVS